MRAFACVAAAVAAAFLSAGCGGSETGDRPARRAAPPAPSCAALVTALQRTRAPVTAAALRSRIRRLAATGDALRRRYHLAAARAAVDAFAAAARSRARAAEAIRDRRPTAARRLFVTARTIDVRAQMLARDLAEHCPRQ
ncbi:MAG TPA: hypothetical protein VK278_01980 [Gaiellaceae bacterium]|nr:hypothetical protein [Gaiellaceae bacterium]